MRITSLENPRIKEIVKLQAHSRSRQREHLMVVEGLDEIDLAVRAGYRPRTVVSAPTFVQRPLGDTGGEVIEVSTAVFEKLSYRERPDGWLAVFEVPQARLEDLNLSIKPLLIVMEAIEKPGNLGGILRTADAAAVDAVLVCDRRADLHGPNVVRASRGTLFSVPLVETTTDEALAFFRSRGIKTLAAAPSATVDYTSQDLRGPLAIAVGAEDRGLSETWLSQADIRVKIPMHGKINSLNVSVATALIVYEALRQRPT